MPTPEPLALTQGQIKARSDKHAAALFARRRDIDRPNDERWLKDQIKESWDD